MNYNVIIGIVLLILSTLIGVELSKKYTKRKTFYTHFNTFNKAFSSEVSLLKTTLPDFINNNAVVGSVFFQGLANKFINKNSDNLDLSFLSSQEKDFYLNYLDNLGKGDLKTCLDFSNSVKGKIGEYLLDASTNEEKKKPLTIKVSFMIGLIAFIVCL